MRHFRVGTRDVYFTMITGLGNDVFLTTTMEDNIVEARIILQMKLQQIISRNHGKKKEIM